MPRDQIGLSSDDHEQDEHNSAPMANGSNIPRPVRVPDRARLASSQAGDIICGRGVHASCHNGNSHLHLTVNKYRELYLSGRRADKAKIIKRVLNEIKSTGARFIRRVDDESDADEWEEVDDKTAYKKISHALRLRTGNESKRRPITDALGGKLRHQGASKAPDARNQLESSSTTAPSTSVPSAPSTINNALPRSIPNALNQQWPTPVPGAPFPSVFNINPSAHMHGPPIGPGPIALVGAGAESSLLTATGRNFPQVFLRQSQPGSLVAVPLWALQQPVVPQVPLYNDAFQQLYTFIQHAIIGAMMQQSGQNPNR